MKNRNKTVILITSIVLILLIQSTSFFPSVKGIKTSDNVITADWMAVTKGAFLDTSPDPRENKIWTTVGGKDLISFTNLGVSNTDLTDKILIYEAEVIFGFEATLHTSVAFDNVYPDIDIHNMGGQIFFVVETTQWYPDSYWINGYSVGYRDIILGEKVPHDYTGSVPLTVNFKEWTGKQPFNVNGIDISTPFYTADISHVSTIDIRDGEVGGYKDVFVDSTGFKEGVVNFNIDEESTSDENADVIAWLKGKNLGWTGLNTTYNNGIQQSVITTDQTGAVYDNPNPATNKYFSFNVDAQIRPEVYEIQDDIELRTAHLWIHQELFGDWSLDVISYPSTKMVKRRVGVHVTNQFIHWDFEVKMIVYASVQNSAELSEAILSDPYLKMGDFIWDIGYVGTREVDIWIPRDPATNWLLIIIVIIVVIVGLYVAWKIYKRRSERTFMLRLAGRGTKYGGL